MSLERISRERRSPDGAEHMRWWIVRGPRGAAQVMLLRRPGGYPNTAEAERVFPGGWMGADLGYHSPTPLYEGHETRRCELFEDRDTCYYDRSSLATEQIPRVWRDSGYDDETIWKITEAAYRAMFGDD